MTPAQNAKLASASALAAAAMIVTVGCGPSTGARVSRLNPSTASADRDSVTALFNCARDVAQSLGYYAIDTAYHRPYRTVELVLAPHERPVIAERAGASTSRFLIAVAGTDSLGRPTLRTTAREYDWVRHQFAVETGFPSPVLFRGLAMRRAPVPLSRGVVDDLRQLRENCGSPAAVSGAD
jgi:hypothetical protein